MKRLQIINKIKFLNSEISLQSNMITDERNSIGNCWIVNS